MSILKSFIDKRQDEGYLLSENWLDNEVKKNWNVKIKVMEYDEKNYREIEIKNVDEIKEFIKNEKIIWINVNGTHDEKIMNNIGEFFNIHSLILEDIVTPGIRPKMDDLVDYIFVDLKSLCFNEEEICVVMRQVSLILGPGYLLSFSEGEEDLFSVVRNKLKNNESKMRKRNVDFLFYNLIDVIFDNYFIVLEKLGELVEIMEDEIVRNPSVETIQGIHELKKEMLFLRQYIWPLREVMSILSRSDTDLIDQKTEIYIRDLYDHNIEIMDLLETFRDMLSEMVDIYLSSLNNQMNAVMKILTLIATVFIPMTFIASLLGMNFQYILPHNALWHNPWGFTIVVLGMTLISIFLIFIFKAKKWL